MAEVTFADLARIDAKLDRLITLISGDGSPERGIVVRLDRVEQWRAELDRRIDSLSARISQVLVALILIVLAFIGSVLTHIVTISFSP